MQKYNWVFINIVLLVFFILLLFPLAGICIEENILLEWNKTFGGRYDDDAYSLIQISDSGYTIAGYTSSKGVGGYDVWVIKLDNKGNMVWDRTYGGSGGEGVYSLIQTSDGGYAVAGLDLV